MVPCTWGVASKSVGFLLHFVSGTYSLITVVSQIVKKLKCDWIRCAGRPMRCRPKSPKPEALKQLESFVVNSLEDGRSSWRRKMTWSNLTPNRTSWKSSSAMTLANSLNDLSYNASVANGIIITWWYKNMQLNKSRANICGLILSKTVKICIFLIWSD